MNTKPFVIIALAAVLVCAAGAYVFSLYEKVTKDVDKPASGLAIQNRYLAAQRLWEKHSIESVISSSVLTTTQLPAYDELVMLDNTGELLTEQQATLLLDWVRNGGTLISNVPPDTEQDIPLFDLLGVTAYQFECECDDDLAQESDLITQLIDPASDNIANTEPTNADHENIVIQYDHSIADAPIELDIRANIGLDFWSEGLELSTYEGDIIDTAGTSKDIHLLRLAVGYGEVTLVSDMSLWHWENIASADNAYLLWLLSENHPKVTLLATPRYPNLLKLLLTHALPALLSFILLVLMSIWYLSHRFGMLKQPQDPHTRSLIYQYRAIGEWRWKNQQLEYLIQHLREQMDDEFAQKIPYFKDMDTARKAQSIATLTGLSTTQTTQLVSPDNQITKDNFVDFVALSQQTRQLIKQPPKAL